MLCSVATMSKGKRFTFTIEQDLFEPLRVQAQKERRSIGSLLNWLASQYLEEQQGVTVERTIQHGGDRKSNTYQGGPEAEIKNGL